MQAKSVVTPFAKTLIGVAVIFSCTAVRADDPPTNPALTDALQRQIDEDKAKAAVLNAQKDRVTAEKGLAEAEKDLRNAQVAAMVPATGNGVTAPTGVATGADTMKFSKYVAAASSVEAIANQVCTDLAAYPQLFQTTINLPEAIAKDASLTNNLGRLKIQLSRVTKLTEATIANIEAKGPKGTEVVPAGLAAVSLGIDVAAGMIKGIAGLAALFKTDRTLSYTESLLTDKEMLSALHNCAKDKITITDLDANTIFTDQVTTLNHELDSLDTDLDILRGGLTKIANFRLANEGLLADRVADVTALKTRIGVVQDRIVKRNDDWSCKDESCNVRNTRSNEDDQKVVMKLQADLTAAASEVVRLKGLLPASLKKLEDQSTEFATKAATFYEAVYTVNATTGLSPIIEWAKLRKIKDVAAVPATSRLAVTVLLSGGSSLTSKRLFGSDRVAYSGGGAFRFTVTDADGTLKFDRFYYNQTGWLAVNFDDEKSTLKLSNFGK